MGIMGVCVNRVVHTYLLIKPLCPLFLLEISQIDYVRKWMMPARSVYSRKLHQDMMYKLLNNNVC